MIKYLDFIMLSIVVVGFVIYTAIYWYRVGFREGRLEERAKWTRYQKQLEFHVKEPEVHVKADWNERMKHLTEFYRGGDKI